MAWWRHDDEVEALRRELAQTRSRLESAIHELERRTSALEGAAQASHGSGHLAAAVPAQVVGERPADPGDRWEPAPDTPVAVVAVSPVPLSTGMEHPVIDDRMVDEIRMLVGRGQKIQAIKKYREATGAGLKQAKDAVEEMERWR